MPDLTCLVAWLRGRQTDREKAWAYLEAEADDAYRELMRDHDAFVPVMQQMKDPKLLIGTARDAAGTDVPVDLELHDPGFAVVQGGTGTGKTTFQTRIMVEGLAQGMPWGAYDFKEGLFEVCLQMAGALAYRMEEPERRQFINRLHIVDPFGESLSPFNICRLSPGSDKKVQAYDATQVLARLFERGLTEPMELLLQHLLLLLMEHDLSLVEAPDVLQDDLLRSVLVERSSDAEVKEFFISTYNDLSAQSKKALLSRLQGFLFFDNLKLMLGADACIDHTAIFERGDPLFGFLGKGPGIPEKFIDIFGSFALQLMFQGAFARRRAYRDPVNMVLDEFFHLLTPGLCKRLETGLASLRSFGLFLTLVMHDWSQVPTSLRRAMLTHCRYMALFRSDDENARYFGDFLPDTDPDMARSHFEQHGELPSRRDMQQQQRERLQRLPNREAFWYDRTRSYRALHIRVPYASQPHEIAGISEGALERFIDAEGIRVGAIGQTRAELQQQIDARRARLERWCRPPVEVTAPPKPTAAKPSSETPAATSQPAGTPTRQKPRIG